MKKIGILLISIALISCSSGKQIKQYKNRFAYKGDSGKSPVSKDLIDRGKTHETHILLKGESPCIKFSISGLNYPDPFTKKSKSIKTFYAVDRLVSIENFKKKNRFVYSPQLVNFDKNWNSTNETELCGSSDDPIGKIRDGDIYRIRITTFRMDNYTFQIEVSADADFIFSDEIPSR